MLYALALDAGRVVTSDELLQKIWGRRRSFRDRTVDVCVKSLRDKVDRRASSHTFIQTRFGVGYKLDPIAKDFTEKHDQSSESESASTSPTEG